RKAGSGRFCYSITPGKTYNRPSAASAGQARRQRHRSLVTTRVQASPGRARAAGTVRQQPAATSPRHVRRWVALCLAALVLACDARHAWAKEVFQLEPEYVYGRNRRPQIGYKPPEVFDPLSDRLYQSGYKNFAPTAIPDELKEVPAMERVEKMGRI